MQRDFVQLEELCLAIGGILREDSQTNYGHFPAQRE